MQEDSENNKELINVDSENLPENVGNNEIIPIYSSQQLELPKTRKIPKSDLIKIDVEEEIHPAATKQVNDKPNKSIYEILVLCGSIIFAVILIFICFPWGRFFRPGIDKEPITIGRSVKLTDEDVKKMGGIDELTPVEKAINEVTKLREKKIFDDAHKKCKQYMSNNVTNKIEYEKWKDIIYNDFEILYKLKKDEVLLSNCDIVFSYNNNDLHAIYYFSKINNNKIPFKNKYTKTDLKNYKPIIEKILNRCQIAENILANISQTNTMKNAFYILIADAYRKKWALNKFDLEDKSYEKSFEYLRKLPKNNNDVLRIKFELLKKCLEKGWTWLHNDPDERTIDGIDMTKKELKIKIKSINEQFKENQKGQK